METKDIEVSGEYLERLIKINDKLMSMYKVKTNLYGGNNIVSDLKEQVVKTYYEGVNRKFERMPTLMKEYMATGDEEVLNVIIDTIADINGYSLMSLVDISYHIGGELGD